MKTNEITLLQQKQYLISLSNKGRIQYALWEVINHKQLKKILENPKVNKDFYKKALHALYQCQDFESLEYHLMMMNSLFTYSHFKKVKEQLFMKICNKEITVKEYKVLRQLVCFDTMTKEYFIQKLKEHYQMSDLECAKVCLLEDCYELAFRYLRQLDDCDDENVMNSIYHYSLYDYVSLKKYYKKKRKNFVFVPVH